MKLKTLDLFAGAGGFTVAGEISGGYETVAFCEIDPYARKVLAKHWPEVPCFDDVTKLKGSDVGAVDVITGGFPCQDLSAAGRGAGLGDGTRSGLFRHMLRLAEEIREIQGGLPYIIFENVPRLLSGPAENPGEWFGEFLWSLAEVGYDAEWFCLSAAAAGAPHKRERVCIVAYANEGKRANAARIAQLQRTVLDKAGWTETPIGFEVLDGRENATHSHKALIERGSISRRIYAKYSDIDGAASQWVEWGGGSPEICRMDDGIPSRSHRLGIMGNAIVPQVFAPVMRALYEAHIECNSDPTSAGQPTQSFRTSEHQRNLA